MSHVNLGPSERVPKTGTYRCQFCGSGGIADFLAQGLDDTALPGVAALRARGQQSTVRSFTAGDSFSQCPNCGPATGWTLIG